MRHNSAAPDTFAGVVKARNHVELWDVVLTWYSPSVTRWLCFGFHAFWPIWPSQIVDYLATRVKEKENSEFKPVKLRLKIDLVSYPAWAEGLVNSILQHERNFLNHLVAVRWSTAPLLSISNGGHHGIHNWWDLMRLKKLSCVSLCHTQCLPDFLVMVIQFITYNSSI